MKIYRQLLLNSEVTKNNRRYTPEVLEIIKNQINSKDPSSNLGTIGYSEGLEIDLSKVAFKYSNAVIEDGGLYVDIELLNTPKGEDLKRMMETEIRFRPGGQATIEGEMPVETLNLLNVPAKVSTDYKIITVAAITPDDDAINLTK